MKSRILLIGKKGQVGHDLQQLLPACGELTAVDHEQLDLWVPGAIRRAVQETRPQLIINAAAYTAVDQAERDEPAARAINAVAPGILAEQAKKLGATFIHYSTDYVFDGTKTTPYEENDPTNPLSAYGRTKLAGEQAIRDSGVAHLIFRTSWVYSARTPHCERPDRRAHVEPGTCRGDRKSNFTFVCDRGWLDGRKPGRRERNLSHDGGRCHELV